MKERKHTVSDHIPRGRLFSRGSTRHKRNVAVLLVASMIIATSAVSFYSCSKKPARLKHVRKLVKVYGYVLGESKDKLFKRAEGLVLISKFKKDKRSTDPRSDMWYCSGALDNTRGIDHVRLTFFDDHLMEVIVYFKDTSVLKMKALKQQIEDEYGVRGVAPDGTVETAYKTYRFNTPDMSITLRRITKFEGTELYIQFLHNDLHHLFLEWQRQSRTGKS
ncbi:hypothetical protein DRQ05_05850 [bacterium]|nr:MAG: hypothetical protein DRQ05_05850 [bacterium]